MNFEFQGKQIEIESLALSKNEEGATLLLSILCEGKRYDLRFKNISLLRIADLSLPFQICGFDIVHTAERGWEAPAAYRVLDFEDDRISFYCEEILAES